jgi:hypothetical protein
MISSRGVISLQASERDALWLHLLWGLLVAGALALPSGPPQGMRIFLLLVAYATAAVALAVRRGYGQWLEDLAVLIPLSALQIFPDWFLSKVLGVLAFPDPTFPKIGTVTAYMAGMWTVPLFLAVLVGRGVEARDPRFLDRAAGRPMARMAAAAAAAFLFVGAEATLWRLEIWHAVGVYQVGHVALYVVVPEVLLGVAVYEACRWAEGRRWWEKLTVAVVVMWLYLGMLAFFYLLTTF